ncbi:hypothetical protein E0Z10_g3822 [Xylaria hypoxylon]|uniref:Uncharacterized protein n=1 Tax=Xylaria hypoxylon TaxID=37992 RepID=A0A4Z0Z090_9PEZI|nr:hypothetical protein E0Z10_g3822 [Xylaria hypoxylon]
MGDEGNILDVAVNRLEQEIPKNEHEFSAYIRHQGDRQRLQQLSIATTSGDTLVIVKFPAGDFIDCNREKWETKKFLMESEQLLMTGSSVFAEALSPNGQARTRRRLNCNYESYRYVLDLTPQIEGDESASEVAELSLSDGVREWWRSHYIVYVSKQLVYGHDDNCPRHLVKLLLEDGTANELDIPQLENIFDYCPIRHRVAILRLLMAIRQGDLILNSAARTATMAVIAKHFDCVDVVKDHILTWLVVEPNQKFIEINAEDALKYAWILKLVDVARVAFQILVVERAVEILETKKSGIVNKGRQSIFGRPRGSVTDEQETCIQYAAQSLIQRAEDLWGRLLSDDVNAYLGITHWPREEDHGGLVCNYMRGIVNDAATTPNTDMEPAMEEHDRTRALYVLGTDVASTKAIYAELSPTQRILTSYFWNSFSKLATSRIPPGHLMFYRFDAIEFHREFIAAVSKLKDKWMPHKLEVNIERTGPLVVGLSDEEFKFLPLWAGGLDDGTGSVYQTKIPDAEHGFPIGPGPSFCTGETIPDDQTVTSGDNDDAATASKGSDTVTMTKGYSVNVTPSQITGPEHEEAEEVALAAATAGLSLTTAQNPSANPNLQEDTVLPAEWAPAGIEYDFDWMADGSERQNLSDLDNSDDDSDDHADNDNVANPNSP